MQKVSQRTTVFAFGEGEDEEVFLKFLRGLYAQGKTQATVKYAGGKGPEYILRKAIAIRSNFSYDHSFILFDGDIAWGHALINRAKKKRFELIKNVPCLEGLLIKILDSSFDCISVASAECKKKFQDEYLGKKRALEPRDLERTFSKEILDSSRKSILELDRIIKIFEGDLL